MSNIPRVIASRVQSWVYDGELYFNGVKQFGEPIVDTNIQPNGLTARRFYLKEPGLIQIAGDCESVKVIHAAKNFDTVYRDGYWNLLVVPVKYNPYYFHIKIMVTEVQFLNVITKYNGLPHGFKTPYQVIRPEAQGKCVMI